MCPTKRDFFDHRYYKINKILMCWHGQWPYQEKTQKWLLVFFTFCCSLTCLPAQIVACFISRHDWSIMIPTFAPIFMHVGCMVKLVNSLLYRDKMQSLLQRIKNDWTVLVGSERVVLERYAEEGRLLTIIYATTLFSAMAVFLILSTVPRVLIINGWANLSSTIVFPVPVYYSSNDEEYYYYIQTYMVFTIVFVCSLTVVEDSMFVVFIQHACGIYSTVGYQIETMIESDDLDIDIWPSRAADKTFWVVVDCIKKHNDAIAFATLLDSAYSTSFLILLGINTLSISFTALQMVLGASPDSVDELIRQILCTGSQILHLFFENYFCQRLTDHTVGIFDSITKSKWYMTSLRTRQLLVFMLMKSVTPWEMKAGKMISMSMENFSAILRTSLSYLTILTSME